MSSTDRNTAMDVLTFYDLYRVEQMQRERRLALDLMVAELRAERRRAAAQRREPVALVRTTSLRRRVRSLVRRRMHPTTPARVA